MEHLVVRFTDPEGPARWQVVDAHGAPMPLGGEGDLEQAAGLAEGRKVALLLPVADVFRSRMALPARGRRAAAKGARYALEDRIAGDVEDLHFATGPVSGDQLDVAAIERERLDLWLRRSREAGLNADTACSEGDALPGMPNVAVALLEQDKLLLRNGGGQLVSAEPSQLRGLVEILCAEHAGEDAAPFRLVIYCEPSLEAAAREAMAALAGREVELRLLQDGVMAQLAGEALSARAVNLLQGEFRSRAGNGQWARKGALAALAVALLYPALLALDGWRAQARYEALSQAVDVRLAQLMPDVSESADLRGEWRRRGASADLDAAERSDDFLRLVGELERSGGERMQVLGLTFGGGSAGARVRAASMDTLEQVRRRLRGGGYAVVIQTATPESNGAVLAELDIRDDRNR